MASSKKKFPKWIIWVIAIVVFLAAIVPTAAAGIRFGIIPLYKWGLGIPEATATPVPAATTAAPAAQAPAAPTVAPATVSLPMTPAIYASLDGKDYSDQGEYLDTNLGERMTFTCRKVVVPAKAWNERLSDAELEAVETTWVSMKVDIPKGLNAVVFATELKQGTIHYKNGVLLTLSPGHYEFSMKNGETVIWYPSQEEYQKNDFNRIMEQIKNGNFDIKSELDFFGITADLLSKVPDDMVKDKNIQIIYSLTSN